jgi:hypothetical protein
MQMQRGHRTGRTGYAVSCYDAGKEGNRIVPDDEDRRFFVSRMSLKDLTSFFLQSNGVSLFFLYLAPVFKSPVMKPDIPSFVNVRNRTVKDWLNIQLINTGINGEHRHDS